MNRILCLLFLSSGLAIAGDLEIENAWIRAVPPSSKATAAFMTFVNKGDKPVFVTGATTSIAGEVKPMVTTKEGDGVMGMAFVKNFSIPAKGRRVLEPGGDHLMLMDLSEVPKAGSTVSLVLATDSEGETGKISLKIPVR